MQTGKTKDNNWCFNGLEVTEAMRNDILTYISERYDSWRSREHSWEKISQLMGPPSYVAVVQHDYESASEFLSELLAREASFFMHDSEQDDLNEFLKELFIEKWGSAYQAVVEADEDADPIWDASIAVNEWIDGMPLSELPIEQVR